VKLLREHTGPLAVALMLSFTAASLLGLWQVREQTGIAVPVDSILPQFAIPNPTVLSEVEGQSAILKDDWAFLPPEEALEFFESLIPVTPAQLSSLNAYAAQAAWTIAGAQEQLVVKSAQESIAASLAEGKAGRAAIKDLSAAMEKAGFTAANPHHLKLVFDQAVSQSLGAGRYRAQRSEGAMRYLPWWIYETMGDDRVRAEHAMLHGFSARASDPIWDTLYPPNGFRCRCMVTADRRASARGEFPTALRDHAHEIVDTGFDTNPAAQMDRWAQGVI